MNLLVTFVVSGLWHGANWTFLAWGAVHGVAQVVENALVPKGYQPKGFARAARTLGTFVFVMGAWVLFRADSLSDAWYIYSHIFSGITGLIGYLRQGFKNIHVSKEAFASAAIMLSALAVHDWPGEFHALRNKALQRAEKLRVLQFRAWLSVSAL